MSRYFITCSSPKEKIQHTTQSHVGETVGLVKVRGNKGKTRIKGFCGVGVESKAKHSEQTYDWLA